jgi:phosphate transport system protein
MTNQKSILDNSITVLKLDIRNLTDMIMKQYHQVIKAITHFDAKLALDVIKQDEAINTLSEDIDLETIIVIARYQPVASDLRRVMTINKLAYELERIADYAKNLAEYVITGNKLNVSNSIEYISSFEAMFNVIFKMLETNLEAFEQEDRLLAREALLMDQEIDEIYQKNFTELLTRFKDTNDTSIQHMISKALILNKQIERAGDHLTNISEQILYLIKGKRFNVE